MCLSDDELNEHERILTALMLLYGEEIPPMETALEGLKWYMSETNHDNYEGVKSDNIITMDYDVDQYRILQHSGISIILTSIRRICTGLYSRD